MAPNLRRCVFTNRVGCPVVRVAPICMDVSCTHLSRQSAQQLPLHCVEDTPAVSSTGAALKGQKAEPGWPQTWL